jgi:hypothetical protein
VTHFLQIRFACEVIYSGMCLYYVCRTIRVHTIQFLYCFCVSLSCCKSVKKTGIPGPSAVSHYTPETVTVFFIHGPSDRENIVTNLLQNLFVVVFLSDTEMVPWENCLSKRSTWINKNTTSIGRYIYRHFPTDRERSNLGDCLGPGFGPSSLESVKLSGSG